MIRHLYLALHLYLGLSILYKTRKKLIAPASVFRMLKTQKHLTVQEAGRRGGKARAKKYSRKQLRVWAALGGWPKGRSREKKPEQ
jgi:hypothetical protein